MIINLLEHVHCEYYYFKEIFDIVKNDFNDDYNVIIGVIHDNNKTETLKYLRRDKKNILVMVSEETEQPFYTPEFSNFDLIFRTYNNNNKFDDNKIFPVPCGYITRLNFPHHKSILKEVNPLPLKDRTMDIFFSGQPTPERIQCVNEAKKINKNSILQLTNGFVHGFELNDYFNKMCNSKIALVPRGASIAENFRYFDAFRSGCVVISTMPLKTTHSNIWYYQECPAILLNSWSELNQDLIDNILNNIDTYEEKNKEYYDRCVSPRGVAKFIINKIKTHI